MRTPAEVSSCKQLGSVSPRRFQISMTIFAIIVILGLGFIFMFMLTSIHGRNGLTSECPTVEVQKGNSCICIMDYKPICGSDEVTYTNSCFLKCAQKLNPDLNPVHEGAC